MWMMGYNDGGEFNMSDAFGSRKLRPLMPRPVTGAAAAAPTNPPPSFSRIHGADFVSLNHHLVSAAMAAEQNKRDFNTQQVVVSSRWNPTPEQLQTLEELYRRGTRTPSAEQIQHITAQLRRYGKIEGKNVFYWFQNHKARERQKRRRQLESASDENPRNTENTERKESGGGGSRTCFDQVEQITMNWPNSTTNCTTLPEKSVLKQRAAAAKAAAATVSECRAAADGWVHFDDQPDLQQQQHQQRRNLIERNDTWQMMHQFSSSPPTNHLINCITAPRTLPEKPKLINPHRPRRQDNLNIFNISPFREDPNQLIHVGDGQESQESQTLQLFPLTSGGGHENIAEKETQESAASMNASNTTPYPFFEFLPLKN